MAEGREGTWEPAAVRRAALALAGIAIVWCGAMVLLQWLRLRSFVHLEYEDDALYLQLLDSIGRGFMENTIHPGHRPSHFIPILYVLWPFYALLGGGWPALWILKTLLIAAGAAALFRLALGRGLSPAVALGFGAMWLALPGVMSLTLSTFRPLTASAGALLWLIEAFVARRLRSMLFLTLLVLLFREDLALTVGLLGLVGLLQRAPVAFIVAPPLVAGIWFAFGTSILSAYTDVIVGTNLASGGLWGKVEAIFEPTHLQLYVALVLPLALLPLGSWVTLVGAVGVAAVALNWRPFGGHLTHLVTPAVAATAAGAVVAFSRLRSPLRRRWGWALAACLLGAHLQPWIPPTLAQPPTLEADAGGERVAPWSPLSPAWYRMSAQDELRWRGLALIPPEASVAATGQFLPALSPRPRLYELGHWTAPFGLADWVVIEPVDLYGGAGSYMDITPEKLAQIMPVITRWFGRVWEEDGVIVLRRLRPGDATGAVRGLLYPHGQHRSTAHPPPGRTNPP